MSRAGRFSVRNVIVFGVCYILPNQQIFRKHISQFMFSTLFFSSLTNWLRGPDEMASRAAFGPRAVVWRPLI